MLAREVSIPEALRSHGIPRRKFLKYCASMTTILGLPAGAAAQIAATLEKKRRPVLVWLEFQDCAGNTESMLRASHPSVAELVLSVFSWEYHETIMAAAGKQAESALDRVVREDTGKYIAVVEGSIPTANPGYCAVGGRSAMDIARQVCSKAAVVIAVGSCAFDGGPQRSAPNPTGAIGIGEAVPNLNLVNVSGCPHNAANTAALLVYWLTYGEMPALDSYKRPRFAYGHIIHDQCERRANFDAGRFVEHWDDDGARQGYCLYKMGCKGPQGNFNCPVVRWNDETSWPVQAGHGCAACASYRFWDRTMPLYRRLPNVPGFGVDVTAGEIGGGLVAGMAAAVGLHAIASIGRAQLRPHGEQPRGGPTEMARGRGLVEREGPPERP